ncbi:MAG: peptide chain release factor 2 [Actinomycetota bacterium]|nr:peptide chain release factor 2 [Actinomycetota bacterium]
MIENQQDRIDELKAKLGAIKEYFDLDVKAVEIARLEAEAAKPDLWSDQERAQKVTRELSQLKEETDLHDGVASQLEDLEILNELALAEEDEPSAADVADGLKSVEAELENLEKYLWFSDELDSHDAILMVHTGAGGTESQDWANMLLRMYLRWAAAQGFKTTIIEVSSEGGIGINSATVTINGPNAYGLLKGEEGVHRLVRISPFDASSRRHTTFASVDVVPAVEEDIAITIEPGDIRVDTYRASGAGGQHVNVTDSAVRITHLPTGIVVQCQNERSQFQNKDTALKILKARLYEHQRARREAELAAERGLKMDIAWGSQIRSYVLHPYAMVKDHRTGVEKGNAQGVLDGDLNDFITGWHRWRLREAV